MNMPEKGWEIITVRTETKRALMQVSRARGVSINDLIVAKLNIGIRRPRRPQEESTTGF